HLLDGLKSGCTTVTEDELLRIGTGCLIAIELRLPGKRRFEEGMAAVNRAPAHDGEIGGAAAPQILGIDAIERGGVGRVRLEYRARPPVPAVLFYGGHLPRESFHRFPADCRLQFRTGLE